tara:strand:- start:180 stop:398 length:219 start_codon:yes stop_codon:yes gene_type:complete
MIYTKRALERLGSAYIIVLSIYTIRVTHEVRLIHHESNPWGSGAYNELHIDYHILSPTIPMDLKWYESISGV